jgi:hypothetical protein
VSKAKEIVEFGDFQTPLELAKNVAQIVSSSLHDINTIIEPTCGTGAFLKAFTLIDSTATELVGWEINPSHIEKARCELKTSTNVSLSIIEQDFFQIEWSLIKKQYKEPILFIGNPPWVTSSELGRILSKNIPKKNNFQGHSGMEAITGKSNFDISEWMLIKMAEFISCSNSAMSFLIKTSVARKIFLHIANSNLAINDMFIREIDAKKHFNVNVSACLFYAKGSNKIPMDYICPIYKDIFVNRPYKKMGIANRQIIADIDTYKELSDIDIGCEFKWRSGIKHDSSKIMELSKSKNSFINGFGETVELPEDYLYPMYKSSNISKKDLKEPEKWMLVTQKKIGDETKNISLNSPRTWDYLLAHSGALDERKSTIYKKAPRFSIFGVGDYTFKPWKVSISGLYKNLKFNKIGPYEGKPIVLDDTCYMLGFDTEEEAQFILELLESDIAKEFILALVFKDNKRPITVALLNRINLRTISIKLDLEYTFDRFFLKADDRLYLDNAI